MKITPENYMAEISEYADYAIGKDVANSNEAHKYIEGETKNKD